MNWPQILGLWEPVACSIPHPSLMPRADSYAGTPPSPPPPHSFWGGMKSGPIPKGLCPSTWGARRENAWGGSYFRASLGAMMG